MSVRDFSEVIPGQVLTFTAAAVFVLGSGIGVLALDNLWILATTPVNSALEWVLTTIVAVVAFGIALLALKVIDMRLEVEEL